MPALVSFDYATIRIAPRVDREEFINAGVIVFCLSRRFLEAKVLFNEGRVRALWPHADLSSIVEHLEALPRVSAGDPDGGPIAQLPLRERFHWLVAPRSTIIQVSPVHAGLCESPSAALLDLFRRLVLSPDLLP